MGALPEAVSKSRLSCRRGVGVVVGLVLLLGAMDLHDPNLHPAVYATPTPVLPGTECENRCEHMEEGCLLAPDHQPATRPGGQLRLWFRQTRSLAVPSPVGLTGAPYGCPFSGSPATRPSWTRAPPAR